MLDDQEQVQKRAWELLSLDGKKYPGMAALFNLISNHALNAGRYAMEIHAEKMAITDPQKISQIFKEAVSLQRFYNRTTLLRTFEDARAGDKISAVSEALQNAAEKYIQSSTKNGEFYTGNGYHDAGYFAPRAVVAAGEILIPKKSGWRRFFDAITESPPLFPRGN